MMNSDELIAKEADQVINPESPAEVTAAEDPAAEDQATVDNAAAQAENPAPEEEVQMPLFTNKEEVLARAQEIAGSEEGSDRQELDTLKQLFYKFRKAELMAERTAFIEAGGEADAFMPQLDPTEETFKQAMQTIRQRRAEQQAEQDRIKQENLKRKQTIIERIKEMASSPEEANKSYDEFRGLQAEWKEIKAVPAENATELWKNYQLCVEQFYDLLKMNSEMREYDFRKNLEAKTRLCEMAEKLADEPDVISASRQLQKLHQEYRETGPVAKEQREEIWNRFKAASTIVNKRHQQYFEDLRAKEEDNLVKKTALCEKIEALVEEPNNNFADWEKHTAELMEIQKEWKTIGFAPQKMNVKIFERFRSSCDKFFNMKTEYYKTLKETYKANIEKKRELIERARAMKDSKEWRKTSDKFVQLQKEWKTIGVVPKKQGDQLWEEFLGLCNEFFEARNKEGAGQRNEEHANLEKKRNIIAQLKELADNPEEGTQQKVQELVEEYNAVGHVPFKEKDKVYDEYHTVIREIYKKLNISASRKRLNNFKAKIKNVAAEKGGNALGNERQRLINQYEKLKSEAQTYENNLGFLNASSKKGNSLIDEMKRKVQKLKDEIELVKDKIRAINEQADDL